jgi:DNA-binding MarR family transcriptional regulator
VNDRARLDLSNYLPYLINRVASAMVATMTEDTLAQHDLSIDMWRVLAALAHGGEQRQIDLVTRTSIDASTMSRLVSRLVRMGLVVRARSKTSSREVVVTLSPKGSALVQRIIPIAHELERTAIAGLPAKDLAVVKRALRHFYDNLVKARSAR